ncbi:MAG TPA: TonB-dependent receptor [Rhodanobacter sp.]|nr:TonB-dependent receptor [Rhodanobacter sp.]
MNSMKFNNETRRSTVRRTALALAVAAGISLSGQVLAQATTGSVFGTAPVSAGETVRIVNNATGLTREVAVGSDGRYGANQLPVGDYTVSLMQNGNAVATKDHVTVSVSGGTQVPFAAAEGGKNIQNLSSITVTANSLPAIDVSSTRQTSVMTAEQLKTLPIAHSAEDIAMLAPGVSMGASTLGSGPTGAPLVSMGGNSVVENAYYLNGFNTTDPVGGSGGVALPYFAIAEQQTITSGYGPEYGRSTGGVISQIGKRGSNDFHAGVYVSYRPSFTESSADNINYNNPRVPVGSSWLAPSQGSTNYAPGYGQIQTGNKQNSDWETVYDAYVSGALIKDKLFFFITAEWQHDSNQYGLANQGVNQVPSNGSPEWVSYASSAPKIYGKLDWNINDNNVLEFTGVRTQFKDLSNNTYEYNYSNQSVGNYWASNYLTKNTFDVGILKYTSYLTDNLTLEAMYGQMGGEYYTQVPAGVLPSISFGSGVNVPPGVVTPNSLFSNYPNPNHTTKVANLRLDMDWKITANHDLRFGIDNMQNRDDHDGATPVGGGSWQYLTPGSMPVYAGTAPYVNTPVPGTYVQQNIYHTNATLAVRQKAQYVEDRWQVTPNLLLDLGLRNDQFANLGPDGKAYVREHKPQWAPRLGFSWDVFGDSTFKVFGNAGRYYLAIPAGLATRNAAMASINGEVTYTYTGIDPVTGLPTGTSPVLVTPAPGVTTPGYYSPDGENGVPGNSKDYASTNLKASYQDEYVLGFQKMLGDTGLVLGMQGTYDRLGNIIDDTDLMECGTGPVGALVNPGKTNYIPESCGLVTWNPNTGQGTFSSVAAGIPGAVSYFPKPSRKYYALDTYLEHTWDGKWYGKVDYVFSRSYGSSEGPTNTNVGQTTNQRNGSASGSTTMAWDFPDIMAYANGEQSNSHRHTLKVFGAYSITPEWTVGATFIMQSGAPIACLSGYGPTNNSDLYGGSFQHFCGGVPSGNAASGVASGSVGSPPGAVGHTPWTHQLNLSVSYVPAWANKHLTLQAEVHNVLNEQNTTLIASPVGSYNSSYTYFSGSTGYYSPTFMTATSVEAPRYMVFSAKYEW